MRPGDMRRNDDEEPDMPFHSRESDIYISSLTSLNHSRIIIFALALAITSTVIVVLVTLY